VAAFVRSPEGSAGFARDDRQEPGPRRHASNHWHFRWPTPSV